MSVVRVTLIWAALVTALGVPIALAATSPQLEWRDAVYIAAGFAGIIALGLLLVQPLLIAGFLPGLSAYRARRVHHWIGGALVAALLVHVAGLWFTSPPDMVDALLFRSPTPFSLRATRGAQRPRGRRARLRPSLLSGKRFGRRFLGPSSKT